MTDGREGESGRQREGGTDEAGEGTSARAEELPIVAGSGGERGKEGGRRERFPSPSRRHSEVRTVCMS